MNRSKGHINHTEIQLWISSLVWHGRIHWSSQMCKHFQPSVLASNRSSFPKCQWLVNPPNLRETGTETVDSWVFQLKKRTQSHYFYRNNFISFLPSGCASPICVQMDKASAKTQMQENEKIRENCIFTAILARREKVETFFEQSAR